MNNTNTINAAEMTKTQAIEILTAVKAKLGRNYKQAIRSAWMNGDYSSECLEEWSSQLQQIRNSFGPTWLVNARA